MIRRMVAVLFVAALMIPAMAMAQGQPGGGRTQGQGGQGGQGGRGNFDPAQMRERFNTMMKEQLGANDDEWKVLQPKIEKVQNAQRDARGGGMFGGRGGRGPGGGDQPESKVSTASRELRDAVGKKETSNEEIAKKLAAYREARDKARADLTAAQKELKELLTPRQEAVLVSMSMLE